MTTASRPPAAHVLAVVLSVVAISLLHYASSPHWLAIHELLKRTYYVPIVIAATLYGLKGGVATAILATVLYLPHIAMGHPIASIELGQYAELVLFNTVAVVTGLLADRLHAERNRYQTGADELNRAYVALKDQTEERARIDRWVAVGRLAAGAAHEIRNPLGGLLGALEILESEFPPSHPKAGFLDLAKADVRRLDNVVSTFLEFAQPASPSAQRVETEALCESARLLVAPSLGTRGVNVSIHPSAEQLFIDGDIEQCERALVNVLLEAAGTIRSGTIAVTANSHDTRVRITIEVPNSKWASESLGQIFEPFAGGASTSGLALAVAKRLIENQHGTVDAEHVSGAVRIGIELPRVDGASSSGSVMGRQSGSIGSDTEPGQHRRTSRPRSFIEAG